MNEPIAKFHVALSFAGEDRVYVEQVASILKANGLRVFYDRDAEIENWGKNLMLELHDVYTRNADYVVVFVSADYERKVWTRYEIQCALTTALNQRREYILPARFDDTELTGLLSTLAFLDLRLLSPDSFAAKLMAKVAPDRTNSPPPEPGISKPRLAPKSTDDWF